MSNPNTIAQVTEAASAVDGTGVTLTTDEPTLFPVGLLVELYPSQTRDGSVLTRAKQTVGYLVTANPGTGQLTGEINYYDLVDPPQVEKGWIIDGRRTASPDNIYDVDDVDFALTTTGLQAAINAASAAPAGGHVRIKGDLSLTTTPITWPITGNVELSADPGVVIQAPTSGSVAGVFHPLGQRSAASTLQANAPRGQTFITHNQTGGLTFAVDDYIQIIDPVTFAVHTDIVQGVSGAAPQSVTLLLPLSTSFLTANSAICYKVTPIPNLYFHDLNFHGGANSLIMIESQLTANARFERLKFAGFAAGNVTGSTGGSGLYSDLSYKPVYRDITLDRCGDQAVAAFVDVNNTGSVAENIQLERCGVGFNNTGTNHFSYKGIKAAFSWVRSINIGANFAGGLGGYDGVVEDCWAHHCAGGGTGIAMRGGSAYVEVVNSGAYANESDGLYIVGSTAEHHLTFRGGNYSGNHTSSGVDIDLATSGTYANRFFGVRYGTRTDSGLGTQWDYTIASTIAPVTNTVTETAVLTALLQAGQLSLYNRIHVRLAGVITGNPGGDRTFTLRVKYGATTMFADVTIAIPTSANGRPFSLDFTLLNNAATNAQIMNGTFSIGDITAPASGQGNISAASLLLPPCDIRGTAAEDSTAAKTLSVTVEMSANDYTITPNIGLVELLG